MSISHSAAYRRRRFFNWAPLGITYALLYMGRYNLTVAKGALGDLMSLEQFGTIFGVGTTVYAFSFVINGPLTDRLGGRFAILMAAAGAGLSNFLMGWFTYRLITSGSKTTPTALFAALYAMNMYFQSFGAVAIVKVNSNWFHVEERGTFSAIFGAIIASGIYLAFDVGYKVVVASQGIGPGGVDAVWWVFFVPATGLGLFFLLDVALVRNMPSHAGHTDFDTGAARLSENEDQPIPTLHLLRVILTNPIVMTVAAIEFCTGVLRNGIMHWYPLYAKTSLVLEGGHTMMASWGLILFVAGVTGGAFAGLVSDRVFQSRRAPAAGGLYLGLGVATVAMIFLLGGTRPEVGWITPPLKPAAAVGLRAGDLITDLDGTPIHDRARFIAALQKPGTYRLTVRRGDASLEVPLTIGEKGPKDLKLRKSLVTIKDYDLGGGKQHNVLHWQGAWAYESGLRNGDHIALINGKEPADWEAFTKALQTDGTANTVTIQRGETSMELSLVFPSYAPQRSEEKAKYIRAGPVQKLNPYVLGGIAFFMSLCAIGAHGLLSGTATMDFGGKRGTATVVGVVDGFVYLGTAVQSFSLGFITSRDWSWWPIFLVPFAILGFLLCTRIWSAKPRTGGGH